MHNVKTPRAREERGHALSRRWCLEFVLYSIVVYGAHAREQVGKACFG